MTVNKLAKGQAPYEAISRSVLQNSAISLDARGLWAMMLSMPDNWEFNDTWLERMAGCGRERRRRMIAELVSAGLLDIKQHRGPDGRHAANTITVHPHPAEIPTNVGSTVGGLAVVGSPAPIKREQIQRETPKNQQLKTLPRNEVSGLPDTDAYFDAFDQFWSAYAKKVGKKAARAQWRRSVKLQDIGQVIAAAAIYAGATDPQFRKDPERWLRDERWNDEPVAAPKSPGQRGVLTLAAMAAEEGLL
jgi:hypothetical protein